MKSVFAISAFLGLTLCAVALLAGCQQQSPPDAKAKPPVSAPGKAASKNPKAAPAKSVPAKPAGPERIEFNASLPAAWPKYIPLAPGASVANGYYMSDSKMFYVVLNPGANPDGVNSYYESFFAKGGYQQVSQFSGAGSSATTYRKGKTSVTLMLTKKPAKAGGKPSAEVDLTINVD